MTIYLSSRQHNPMRALVSCQTTRSNCLCDSPHHTHTCLTNTALHACTWYRWAHKMPGAAICPCSLRAEARRQTCACAHDKPGYKTAGCKDHESDSSQGFRRRRYITLGTSGVTQWNYHLRCLKPGKLKAEEGVHSALLKGKEAGDT